MAKQVFKYWVGVNDKVNTVELPEGATILHVEVRYNGVPDKVQFWAEFDNPFNKVERRFQVFATGHEIPDDFIYVGTAITADGRLVWHLYEAPRDAS